MQAIERSSTGISYVQLLQSMSQALEQLSAQQGKLPPKLPSQVGGLFGGLVNKLVSLGYSFRTQHAHKYRRFWHESFSLGFCLSRSDGILQFGMHTLKKFS